MSKGSNLFWCKESQICSCVRKAKLFYKRVFLEVTATKERDYGKILKD